jgi:superfamily II DNA/RNA helicase
MIHGDRSQSQRTSALTAFQQGRIRVLVATDLASRGIHVQDIAHVINYDLPELAENFIHRVGRTGRAGKHGVASTLFTRDQRSDIFNLERILGLKMERLRAGELDSAPMPATALATPAPTRNHDNRAHATLHADRSFSSSSNASLSGRSTTSFRDNRPDHERLRNDNGTSAPRRAQVIALPGEVLQLQSPT